MKRAIKRAVSRRAKFLWSTPALREGCAAVAGVKTKVKAQAEAKAVPAAEAKAKARATARAEAEAKAAQAEAEEQACNQQSRRLQRRPQQRSSHMTTSSALSCRTSPSLGCGRPYLRAVCGSGVAGQPLGQPDDGSRAQDKGPLPQSHQNHTLHGLIRTWQEAQWCPPERSERRKAWSRGGSGERVEGHWRRRRLVRGESSPLAHGRCRQADGTAHMTVSLMRI